MAYNNDLARNKLIEIINQGLRLKAIALNVGIDANDLSRFKGGMDNLKPSDVEILSEYLNEVHIPQRRTVTPEKQMTMRERLLESRNKQNEEKPKRRRRKVSLNLLNELES